MTDHADRERIIDKVQKLYAHAESAKAIGNEAEAQAFAAKIQELLTAYKLSQADIHRAKGQVEEPINMNYVHFDGQRNSRLAWTEQLARIVCPAYYCRFFVCTGTTSLGIIGAETDRQVCEFMLVTLARFIMKLSDREARAARYRAWVAAGKPSSGAAPEARGFKADFIAGFIVRLRQRFDDEIRPKVDPKAQANTQAIVLLRRDTLTRVDQWAKDNLKLHAASRTNHSFRARTEGYKRGIAAANEINLKPNAVSAGSPKAPKELR